MDFPRLAKLSLPGIKEGAFCCSYFIIFCRVDGTSHWVWRYGEEIYQLELNHVEILATSSCVIRVGFAQFVFELATRLRLFSTVFLFKISILEIGFDTPTNYLTWTEMQCYSHHNQNAIENIIIIKIQYFDCLKCAGPGKPYHHQPIYRRNQLQVTLLPSGRSYEQLIHITSIRLVVFTNTSELLLQHMLVSLRSFRSPLWAVDIGWLVFKRGMNNQFLLHIHNQHQLVIVKYWILPLLLHTLN